MIHNVILITILLLSTNTIGQQFINVTMEQNITEFQNFAMSNANGMTFYDFDEDGWDDLTYPMHNDSIIFYKNFNGQFQKISSFLLSDGDIRQLTWVDYDNDGDLDLCISYDSDGLRIYDNDGNFSFTDVSISSGVYPSVSKPYGFSFIDYDLDNDLDIYLSDYSDPSSQGRNMFFENQGNGTFIEKAIELGIDNGAQPSFMGVWFDYNNDDLMDLHVINDRDMSNDAFYENSGNGIFNDVAVSLGIANQGQNPMTSSISDYNNDGFQDIFLTDFGVDSILTGAGPYHYKLFKNENGNSFSDKAPEYNMSVNDFGWGALWVDYNNDMYEDLYIATGNTSGNEGALTNSILYRNDGGSGFTKLNDLINGNAPAVSFCPVKGDINNDGFYDIAVLNLNTPPDILLNEGNGSNYIKITPVGIESNRMAIGAEIRLFTDGTQQLQTVFCGEQLFAQNSQHKIFGVGDNEIIDSIHVHFPSGLVARRYQVPVNQSINIYEEIFSTIHFELIEDVDSILLCNGDSLLIELSNYENYQWSDGSQDSSLLITSAGTYYFEAFNASGDTVYRSNDLVIEFESPPLVQLIVEEVNCNNQFSGTASLLFADSAFIDSTYWSNGDHGMTADSLTVASDHWYTFITNNSCSYSSDFSINNIESPNIQFITSAQSENEQGSISIFVFGGTPPYTYILEGDTVESYIDDLNAGIYELLVTDAYGCSAQASISIQFMPSAVIAEHERKIDIKLTVDHIEICAPKNHLSELNLYDLSGKNVLSRTLKKENFKDCKKFNFTKPSGIYIAMITEMNGSVHRKRLYKP
tara:strand:+ start:4076 stop:6499 length:2424 start_codon:yes stop_codon:yes gene_type:complete